MHWIRKMYLKKIKVFFIYICTSKIVLMMKVKIFENFSNFIKNFFMKLYTLDEFINSIIVTNTIVLLIIKSIKK